MELRISIDDRSVFLLLIGISIITSIGIVFAYGTNNPEDFGHTWGEMTCSGCITSANIQNGQVMTADIGNGQVMTADIADKNVTNAKIKSVAWSKVSDRPRGTWCGLWLDGNYIASCLGSNPKDGCPSGYKQGHISITYGSNNIWFCVEDYM